MLKLFMIDTSALDPEYVCVLHGTKVLLPSFLDLGSECCICAFYEKCYTQNIWRLIAFDI